MVKVAKYSPISSIKSKPLNKTSDKVISRY